jgi:hypothetical protein
MTQIGSLLGNTSSLRRIIPIGHPETFSKPDFLNYITYLSICLGKGGFDAHVWVILLLDVIGIDMIPMTYVSLEGILFVVARIFLIDRYIWGND